MPDYRVYQLTADGEPVLPPAEVFATSDEAAINFAARNTGVDGCEIWQRDRFVAAIVRQPPDAAGVRAA